MLRDWYNRLIGNVPSVYDFKKWLDTKDPNEEYEYINYGHIATCAFGQYLIETKKTKAPGVGVSAWALHWRSPDRRPIPAELVKPLNQAGTFGELKRILEHV
jgi:hypothetical protein